jgi:hypothetical protein
MRGARGGPYQASLEPLASIKCERRVTLPPVGLVRYVEGPNGYPLPGLIGYPLPTWVQRVLVMRTKLGAVFSLLMRDE